LPRISLITEPLRTFLEEEVKPKKNELEMSGLHSYIEKDKKGNLR